MKFIEQTVIGINRGEGEKMCRLIESAARTCYRSEDRATEDSYKKMIRGLIAHGHESPLEFGHMSFEIVTSRAVLAELTRHRLASFCVESQRYCDYFDGIQFIEPYWFHLADEDGPNRDAFIRRRDSLISLLYEIEQEYKTQIESGALPEAARDVLPNATAVRLRMSMNYRELRHFLKLRTSRAAYPPMRKLAISMAHIAATEAPCVFDDIVETIDIGGSR